MLNLILAILCSTLISVIMRLSSHKVTNRISMLSMNYLTCLVLGMAFAGVGNLFPSTASLPLTLGMGGFNGLLYLSSFVIMQSSIQRNGVVMPSIFMKLGLLVPMVLSIILFGEVPTWLQIIGFVIAVFSIILINSEPGQTAGKVKLDLILLLLVGGSGDAMSKVFEEIGDSTLSSQFLLYTFGAAFLFSLVLLLIKKEKFSGRGVLYGILIGIPNYFSAKFLLQSLTSVPAVIAYPTFSVATILLVTLAGTVLFKEKLTHRQWIALSIILVALVLLNV